MNTTERDQQGRFATGNRGGPGRPKRETEREYLGVILRLCPPKTWGHIVEKAVADATNGDDKARAFLAKYLLPAESDPYMDVETNTSEEVRP